MDLQFILTPLLKSSIDRIVMNVHKLKIDKETKDLIDRYSNSTIDKSKYIPYSLIKKISEFLKEIYLEEEQQTSNNNTVQTTNEQDKQSNNSNNIEVPCFLQDILKGSTVYIEPKPVEIEDPEKIAKRQYLQGLYNEQRYKKMVKNVAGEREDAMELGSISSQASIGLNILATFFTLLACGLFLGGKMWDSYVLGLALGLAFGIIGVAAEVWLFVIKSSQVQFEKDKLRVTEERIGDIKLKRRIREIKKGISIVDQNNQKTLTIVDETEQTAVVQENHFVLLLIFYQDTVNCDVLPEISSITYDLHKYYVTGDMENNVNYLLKFTDADQKPVYSVSSTAQNKTTVANIDQNTVNSFKVQYCSTDNPDLCSPLKDINPFCVDGDIIKIPTQYDIPVPVTGRFFKYIQRNTPTFNVDAKFNTINDTFAYFSISKSFFYQYISNTNTETTLTFDLLKAYPQIQWIDPSISSVTKNGGVLTINGDNFGYDANNITIQYDGTPYPIDRVYTDNSILMATIPNSLNNIKNIYIQSYNRASKTFDYRYVRNVAISVKPYSTFGGFVFTLIGFNSKEISEIRMNDQICTIQSVVNYNSLICGISSLSDTGNTYFPNLFLKDGTKVIGNIQTLSHTPTVQYISPLDTKEVQFIISDLPINTTSQLSLSIGNSTCVINNNNFNQGSNRFTCNRDLTSSSLTIVIQIGSVILNLNIQYFNQAVDIFGLNLIEPKSLNLFGGFYETKYFGNNNSIIVFQCYKIDKTVNYTYTLDFPGSIQTHQGNLIFFNQSIISTGGGTTIGSTTGGTTGGGGTTEGTSRGTSGGPFIPGYPKPNDDLKKIIIIIAPIAFVVICGLIVAIIVIYKKKQSNLKRNYASEENNLDSSTNPQQKTKLTLENMSKDTDDYDHF
ncbi:hypothetical protein PPL_12518 [Heterostelium album PN500]|uniref:IPT/TIG domain-containing protein n=1 Tax=Heterostelium pallidum (strain ATCC 26659 / Pp 5 / PN500) TaxID=670386 RepID=D3BMU5_HETP5|nr:hypothetical protein PPL_12518 [Heterostelium album PN500]EFA77307.1 hypothetical protein PPL_12518 [Heterostelium album PN500]|eukprot:XP_020429436.1 hypothetical protein PPL_12518 [Heterostelium album PN500]